MADAGDPRALLEAYLHARYRYGAAGTPLVIGGMCAPAPRPGRVHALVTACNPGSQPFTEADNRARMAALHQRLDELELAFAPARAEAPDGRWREPSCWLTDVETTHVDDLAREFGQNACVVVSDAGQVRLRVYRGEWHACAGGDLPVQWVADDPDASP